MGSLMHSIHLLLVTCCRLQQRVYATRLQRLTVVWHQAMPSSTSSLCTLKPVLRNLEAGSACPRNTICTGLLRAPLEVLSGGMQVKRTQLYLTTLQMQIHIYRGDLAGAQQQLDICMGLTHTGAEYRPGFIRCCICPQKCMP